MEQIRLDPLSPSYTKRDIRQGTAMSDLFANLLDGKLKKSSGLTLANDPDIGVATLDVANVHKRRPDSNSPRRIHQTPPNGRVADDRDTFRLKTREMAEAQMARRDRVAIETRGDYRPPVAPKDDSAGGCYAAETTNATPDTAGAIADYPDTTPRDFHDGNGRTADGQPQPGAPEQVADEGLAAASTVAGQNPQLDDIAAPGVAVPNAVSTDKATAIAQAALAAAAMVLPDGAICAKSSAANLKQQTELAALATTNVETQKAAIAVNDNKAQEELTAPSADQALVVGRAAAQEAQSAGAIFRQSPSNAKTKAQGPGQGAANAQTEIHQTNQPPPQRSLSGSHAADTGASLSQEERSGGAVSAIDSEFGTADQSGTAGWALHLAQGAAGKRADFIANLRQHLQNLPTHEQVAIHIQRAVADRLGKLTVELSPVELGRIQVKLNIDEENRVAATVTVERPGTLELLQRDSRALERALHEAGLKTDSDSLSFTLQGGETGDFDQNHGFPASGRMAKASESAERSADSAKSGRLSVIETADGLVDVEI